MHENTSESPIANFPSIDTDNLLYFLNYSEASHIYWWIDDTSLYFLLKFFLHYFIFFLWEFSYSLHSSLILPLLKNFKMCIILKFVFGCPWIIFLWLIYFHEKQFSSKITSQYFFEMYYLNELLIFSHEFWKNNNVQDFIFVLNQNDVLG